MVYAQSNAGKDAKDTRLLHMASARAVQHMPDILRIAQASQDFITRAFSAAFEHVPATLLWLRQGTSSDFHALDGQRRLYSINLLNGIVLLDGYPPRLLPHTVTEHPLFQRSFGEAAFEVSLDACGTFCTSRPVDGYFYKFKEVSGSLLITEMHEGRSLRLLEPKSFGSFPQRLVDLHSHWEDQETAAIVFRPVHFRRKEIHFIQTRDEECCQIPEHLMERNVDNLLQHPDVVYQLVGLKAQVVDVLSKFEHPDSEDFIHAYARRGDENAPVEKLDLPRVNMAFSFEGGTWLSRDYRGYQLAKVQKLSDTLVDFDGYLVLERSDPNDLTVPAYKIILQDAEVKLGKPLSLNIDFGSGSKNDTVCFDVHERFGHLQAESVQSRLLLANLFAGTGCDVPDPRLGVTGMEFALDLVRQCWVNRPLTQKEHLRC
ncbi:unnamed protein product [Symbiodinium pilosum]|uniref:Uncharacterized protein n=1 Tax=Symbiodinium pilosum TaxID=2952 RepID=A0A812WSG8_SYMPI|nr:unnamed protein product [Symbiodinium pilosum]